MAIDIHETTGSSLRLYTSTLEVESVRALPTDDVLAVVNTILGYDVEEQRLLAEGYHVMAKDAADWADASFAAQVETLPEK
jgi:hypothetical protein